MRGALVTRTRVFLLSFLAVALVLAAVVSSYASGSPDGLERAASDAGFGETAEEHALDGSPFADYATAGVDSSFASTAISGIVGVLLTALIGVGLFLLVRRRSARE